jgi:fatty acid desaturase
MRPRIPRSRAENTRILTSYSARQAGDFHFGRYLEHHLFPKVCSVHYPAVSRVVRQAAAAHGAPYHEQPMLLRAILSHYRMLKYFGREAGSDASGKQGAQIRAPPCPTPASTITSPLPQS